MARTPWPTYLWTFWFGSVTLGLALPAVGSLTGLLDSRTADDAPGVLMLAVMTGAITTRGIMRLRRLRGGRHRPDQSPALTTQSEQRRNLPGPASAAHEPARRLAEAEDTLAQLLDQISASRAVPPESINNTRRAADRAATELWTLAGRLEAVEQAVEHSPQAERATLTEGVHLLRAHLDHGLDTYRHLVGAAGRVLIASGSVPSGDELTDASENLAGLAQALHELSAREHGR